jgi:hypothetical protein
MVSVVKLSRNTLRTGTGIITIHQKPNHNIML